ncbi:MAG: transcriptional regulator [Clostridia bacterium]|nr:transcriptional regulator [Clostridia bacterium]
MATSLDFVLFVCEQINRPSEVRYRKMFGEYVVYINDKPLVLLCDNTAFVKKIDCVSLLLEGTPTGHPFEGAREHYILDVENTELTAAVLTELEKVVPVPKPKKRKNTKPTS